MPTNILMPALSPTMEEGTLAKWLKKEGDAVKAGDVIAEIETDKATMEVEAVDEGTLGKILVPAGTENVKVNAPIAVLLEEGEDAGAVANSAPPPAAAPRAALPAKPEAKKETPAAAPPPRAAKSASETRVLASPLARRIAQDRQIDLARILGTGPHGRIVKADVEAEMRGAAPRAESQQTPRPAPLAATAEAPPSTLPDARLFFKEGEYEFVPHDNIRKSIARRLTASKRDIPHYYLTVDCEIDALLRVRRELNDKSPKDGPLAYKLSVNDFVVKACATALTRVPGVNASWTDAGMLRHKHADIGVAVTMDFGLITPIVFRAEGKGLAQISNEVKDLAVRAKAKKLKPQEFEGGTFAVSNLGMFGMKNFTAVINPPHAAILAVGMGEERPVVKNGALAKATVMTVQLSCDHRVIDGALGAKWLQVFKTCIEDPVAMLL